MPTGTVPNDGKPVIPENRKEKVIRQMNAIMHSGGMMSIETAEMFGYKVYLLTPVRYDRNGEALFHFNYFSNELWEDVCFCQQDCSLHSGKMGSGIFSEVLSAMYYLIELNSEEDNLVSRDVAYGSTGKYIGWINHVCDAKYVDEKTYFPWKIAEILHGCKGNGQILNIISAVTAGNTNPYSLFESMFVLDFNKAEMMLKGNTDIYGRIANKHCTPCMMKGRSEKRPFVCVNNAARDCARRPQELSRQTTKIEQAFRSR